MIYDIYYLKWYYITQNVCGANGLTPIEDDDEMVKGFRVYPNPFQTQGTIEYTLFADQQVTIYISDITGKKVALLSSHEQKSAGIHKVDFDGSQLASGMYYCTIVAGDYVNTQKVMLTK